HRAHLHWLLKAGSDNQFVEAWNTNSSKFDYKNGEINPLHLMALYRRENLLSRVPGIEKYSRLKDSLGKTAGHYAAMVGNDAFLKKLQNPERTIGYFDEEKNYPIHLAVELGHFEIAKWMIDTFDLKTINEAGSPKRQSIPANWPISAFKVRYSLYSSSWKMDQWMIFVL
ncbi:MAG: ankyrin repeat domain-containing protein, partial [Verrucomicrobia bacterium]|nr:ankyrin repeat domain-containing protein [Verrucomicrobiota bacterium]